MTVEKKLQPNDEIPPKLTEPEIINASHGTYEYLEQIGNYQFTNPTNHTRIWVLKEEVCAETGNSCMDFTIRERTDTGGTKDRHAHITQDGNVARLETYLWDTHATTGAFKEGETPDIGDMLSDLKNILSREDIEKYPR